MGFRSACGSAHARLPFLGIILFSVVFLVASGPIINASVVHSATLHQAKPPPPPARTPTARATSAPTKVVPRQRPGPFALVLVIDAARYDEIDLSRMPNLARLVARGTQY